MRRPPPAPRSPAGSAPAAPPTCTTVLPPEFQAWWKEKAVYGMLSTVDLWRAVRLLLLCYFISTEAPLSAVLTAPFPLLWLGVQSTANGCGQTPLQGKQPLRLRQGTSRGKGGRRRMTKNPSSPAYSNQTLLLPPSLPSNVHVLKFRFAESEDGNKHPLPPSWPPVETVSLSKARPSSHLCFLTV